MKNQSKPERRETYDAIVIGSGLSGLTTAGLLTKVNKKRVLVLERHYEMGGLTHEFKRGPYSWDIGLHYVGNMQKRLLDWCGWFLLRFLTNGKLKWNKMPNPFEKLLFPGLKVDINEGVGAYKKSLISQFPHEKKAIKRYLRDVQAARRWVLADFFSRFLHPPLKQLFKGLRKINMSKALMTTADYLDSHIKDERLKSVLAARWGNFGVPPQESAFAIHAVIEHHYYVGGCFPEGGAEKIGAYIEQTIEETGGCILVNREVTEIILEDKKAGKKAVGVRVKNLSSPDKEVTEYYAKQIISSTGAPGTYLKLLPSSLNLPIQEQLKKVKPGYSGIDLYLGLKESPEKLGIKGENYWISDGFSFDLFQKKHKKLLDGDPCYCFVSFPSMKSGTKSAHTADIVTIFPYDTFKKWENQVWKEREVDYYELKEQVTESLLTLVEKYIPGFRELIVYKELATPLTFRHFSGRKGGQFYGIPGTPDRYRIEGLEVKTPIENLYLTGGDLLTNGIAPALFSGMATVSHLNGFLGIMKVFTKAFSFSPKKQKDRDYWKKSENYVTSDDKIFAILEEKKETPPYLVEVTFKLPGPFDLLPGQHVKLQVGEAEWRSYSVARAEKGLLKLIIDTRPEGHGVSYIKKLQPGDSALLRMPLTDLIYHKSDRDIVLIATGTGLVPFLHFLEELKKEGFSQKVHIIFGCMTEKDNYLDEYVQPFKDDYDIETHVCVEKPQKKSGLYHGLVTTFIKEKGFKPGEYDFYICGHPHMTKAMLSLLYSMKADHVYW